MKRYIITIFLIFSTFIFAKVRIEDIKNKKLIDNIAYFKNESLPFSGKFIGNNIEEEYLEGVREGYYKGEIIIDNEKFICEGRFSNGLKNGEWIIKSFQGNLKAILKYQYDRPIGEWKYFYPNGNIFEIDRFKEGELQGSINVFNNKGTPKMEMNFDIGLLNKEFTTYYTNGNISTVANFNYGKLDGNLLLFTTQGVKTVEGYYILNKREGEWKFYYSSGELKTIINYKDGKRDGESIIYGKGGEILQKLKFLDGIEVGENEEYKNYGDKILDGFKKFTDELEYKKYDDILDEI